MKLSDLTLKEKLLDGKYLWKHRPDYSIKPNNAREEYAIRELEKGYIYFSKPEDFNDPYDCFYGLAKPKCDEKKLRKYFQDRFPGSNRKERKEGAKILASTDGAEIIKNTEKAVIEKVGVASFTISCGNQMMWSHYSNFHKGLCLGFNPNVDPLYFSHFGVNYLSKDEIVAYKPFEYDPTDTEQFQEAIMHIVSTKSFNWQEEYERRIIREQSGEYPFPPESLEFVVFGWQSEQKFIDKVRRAISENGNYRNVTIFKMSPSGNVFDLDFLKL
ncbi:MAG: DUF2971 domain-containing protein [Cyclobacteriaceae bacterium]